MGYIFSYCLFLIAFVLTGDALAYEKVRFKQIRISVRWHDSTIVPDAKLVLSRMDESYLQNGGNPKYYARFNRKKKLYTVTVPFIEGKENLFRLLAFHPKVAAQLRDLDYSSFFNTVGITLVPYGITKTSYAHGVVSYIPLLAVSATADKSAIIGAVAKKHGLRVYYSYEADQQIRTLLTREKPFSDRDIDRFERIFRECGGHEVFPLWSFRYSNCATLLPEYATLVFPGTSITQGLSEAKFAQLEKMLAGMNIQLRRAVSASGYLQNGEVYRSTSYYASGAGRYHFLKVLSDLQEHGHVLRFYVHYREIDCYMPDIPFDQHP